MRCHIDDNPIATDSMFRGMEDDGAGNIVRLMLLL
jgi:hypothetical protein